MSAGENITRRPLKSRDTKWAVAIAGSLARRACGPTLFRWQAQFFAAGWDLSMVCGSGNSGLALEFAFNPGSLRNAVAASVQPVRRHGGHRRRLQNPGRGDFQ